MKLSRIIKEPTKKAVSGQQNKMVLCLCDDGNEYTCAELAEIWGLETYQGAYQRLRRVGWDHPDLFTVGKIKTKPVVDGGNAAWQTLGDNRRMA